MAKPTPTTESKTPARAIAATSFPTARLFFLALLLGASVFLFSRLAGGVEAIAPPAPTPPDHSLLHTRPPSEVALELTGDQLTELTEAYEQGFNNPEPDDPCTRLQLLPYKKLSAWRRQFQKRGFTMAKVRDMLAHGRRVPFTHPEKGVTYTKIFDAKGNWIVVDFVDCIIWQVAPYNFK